MGGLREQLYLRLHPSLTTKGSFTVNKHTSGVIVLITFLVAMVAIVWILASVNPGKTQEVRIDSAPRHTHVASGTARAREIEAKTPKEGDDAYI